LEALLGREEGGLEPGSLEGCELLHVAVDQIDPNPYQPRRNFPAAEIASLADSLRQHGMLQPILVRAIGERYQLIAGERRLRASIEAQLHEIPAQVMDLDDQRVFELAMVENLQREDLNCVEQARAYERLGREFGLTQEQMAQRTGKERSSVANFLRLLKLPSEVQALVEENKLSFGHAKALMSLDSPEAVLKLANRAVALSMSVRQVEGTVHRLVHPEPKREKAERQIDPNVREAERQLQRALGVRVQITDNKGKGRIVIEYKSLEDFDRVVEVLGRES